MDKGDVSDGLGRIGLGGGDEVNWGRKIIASDESLTIGASCDDVAKGNS